MSPFVANQAMQIGAHRTGGPLHETASNYHLASIEKKRQQRQSQATSYQYLVSQASVVENNFEQKNTTTYQDWMRPKHGTVVTQNSRLDSRALVNKTELGNVALNSQSFRAAGTAAGSSQNIA